MNELSWAGAVATAIAVVMGGVLLAILSAEGDSSLSGAVVIAVAAAAAGVGTVATRPPWRIGCLWISAGILGGIGMLGILSIGLPLLVAAAFAVAGVAEPARVLGRQWLTMLAALTVPVCGGIAVALYVATNA